MALQAETTVQRSPAPATPGRSVQQALRLGQGHLRAGDVTRAEEEFRSINRQAPDCAEAWFFLGVIEQGRRHATAAASHYERAIELAPDLAEAHNNLGIVLQDQGEVRRAEGYFRQAIHLMPDYPEAYNNLGNALQDQGKYEEAIESYQQALKNRPGYLDAIKHLGNAQRALGQLDEALATYNSGLRLAPDHILLHMSRAMIWIQQGDFARGWAECDWRLRSENSPIPAFSKPLWDGSMLDGRTILVYAEQGLGDTIQFLRYLPLIADRGGRVVLVCAPPLVKIAASCQGVARVVTAGSTAPEFDCFVPLLSLPRIFGTTLETIPSTFPYVNCESELADHWGRELCQTSEFRIGVVWQGNPVHTKDRERSFPLQALAPVARLNGVRLLSLQKNFGLDQIPEFSREFGLEDLGARLNDLVDTAAVMKNLDLVISADSSPAHLAGALGVRVWVALPLTADWRWMSGRDDSPWYPSLRLFRQHVYGDWDGVFRDMAQALQRLIEDRRTWS